MGEEEFQHIQDPSEIGTGGLSELQQRAIRWDKYRQEYERNAFIDDNHNMINNDYDYFKRMNQINRQYLDYGEDTVGDMDGFGDSSYDNSVRDMEDMYDLEEHRANEQSGALKLLNGLGKAAVLTGTTFLEHTIGNIYGIGSAIINGDASKLYDNNFSNKMREIEAKAEEWMPNYRTNEERNNAWYQNLGTANFWADQIKNSGFTVGTGLGMAADLMMGNAVGLETGGLKSIASIPNKLLGKGFSKTFGREMSNGKLFNTTEKILLSTADGFGEARIEASNNSREWFQEDERLNLESARNEYNFLRKKALESLPKLEDLSDEEKNRFLTEYNDEAEKIIKKRNETTQKNKERSIQAGNMDFVLENILLTATNYHGTYSSFRTNFTNAERCSDIRKGWFGIIGDKYKARGVAGEIGKQAFAEGVVEEGGQGFLTDFARKWYSDKYNEEEIVKQGKLMNVFKDAWSDTYGSLDRYDEIFAGALTSVFGVTMPHRVTNKNGEVEWRIMQGGIFDKSIRESVENNKAVAEYLNKRTEELKASGMPQYLIQQATLEQLKADAAKNGDKFEYKNADYQQLINDVLYWSSAGRLSDLKNLIGPVNETLTDDDIMDIVKATDVEKDGKLSNNLGLRDKDGNLLLQTDEEKNAFRDKIHKQRKEAYDMIDNARAALDHIDMMTGGRLNSDQLQTLTFMKLYSKNLEDRIGEMMNSGKANSAFKALSRIVNDDKKKYMKFFDEVKDSEGNTTSYKLKDGATNSNAIEAVNRLNSVLVLDNVFNQLNEAFGEFNDGRAYSLAEIMDSEIDMHNTDGTSKKTKLFDLVYNNLSNLVSEGRIDEANANEFLELIDDTNRANAYRNALVKQMNEYLKPNGEVKLAKLIDGIKSKVEKRDIKKSAENLKNELLEAKKAYDEKIAIAKNNNDISLKREAINELNAKIALSRDKYLANGVYFNQSVLNIIDNDKDLSDVLKNYKDRESFGTMLKQMVANDKSLSDGEKSIIEKLIDFDGDFSENVSEMSNFDGTNSLGEVLKQELPTREILENGDIASNEVGKTIDNLTKDVSDNEVNDMIDKNKSELAGWVMRNPDNILVNTDGSLSINDKGSLEITDWAKRIIINQAIAKYQKLVRNATKYVSDNANWSKDLFSNQDVIDIMSKFEDYDVVETNAGNSSNTMSPDTVTEVSEEDKEKARLKKEMSIMSGNILFDNIGDNASLGILTINEDGVAGMMTKDFVELITIFDSVFNIDGIVGDSDLMSREITPDNIGNDIIETLLKHCNDDDIREYLIYANQHEEEYAYEEEVVHYVTVNKKGQKTKKGNHQKEIREKVVKIGKRTVPSKLLKRDKETIVSIINFAKTLQKQRNIMEGKIEDSISDIFFNVGENGEITDNEEKSTIIEFIKKMIKKNMKESDIVDAADSLAEVMMDKGGDAVLEKTKKEIREIVKNNLLNNGEMKISDSDKAKSLVENALKDVQKTSKEAISKSAKAEQPKSDNIEENEDNSISDEVIDQESVADESIIKSNENSINESDTENKVTLQTIAEQQVYSILPQTTEYNLPMLRNGVYMREAEAIYHSDQNVKVDPEETERYLDKSGAFDFVNSGKLSECLNDKSNPYAGQIYIITDEKLNGTQGDEYDNYYYSIQNEDGSYSPSFFVYENAKYTRKGGVIRLAKETTDGEPLRIKKDSNGRNISVKDCNDEIEVTDEHGAVTKTTIQNEIRNFRAKPNGGKSVHSKLMFAVRTKDGKFQPIGLVPSLSSIPSKLGSNAKYITSTMDVQTYADIMTGRIGVTSDSSEHPYTIGLPSKLSSNDIFGIRSSANRDKHYKSMVDAYQAEAFQYFTTSSSETLANNGYSVKNIDNKTIEVTNRDGRKFVISDTRNSVVPNEFFANLTDDEIAEKFKRTTFKEFDSIKSPEEKKKAIARKYREVIRKYREMCEIKLEKNSPNYIEDGSIKAVKMSGLEVISINNGINRTIPKSEPKRKLNDDLKKGGKSLSTLISTGEVRIGVVLQDKDGNMSILSGRDKNGNTRTDIVTNKALHKGMAVMLVKNPNGTYSQIPLIVEKYGQDLFNDETINNALNKAVDRLFEINGEIDFKDKNNPLFRAFNAINEVIHFPINTKIFSNIEESTGIVETKKINIEFDKDNGVLTIKDGVITANVIVNPENKEATLSELKNALAKFNRPIRIVSSTDLRDASSVNNLIKRGILSTNLQTLDPINAFAKIGNKQKYDEEKAEKDSKIYGTYRQYLQTKDKASKKRSTEGLSFVKIGNLTVSSYTGQNKLNPEIVDADGIPLEQSQIYALQRTIGFVRNINGTERRVVFGTNIQTIVSYISKASTSSSYGKRNAVPDLNGYLVGGILKIKCSRFTDNYVYFDTVTGMMSSKEEFDKYNTTDGESKTTEEVNNIVNQKTDSEQKQDTQDSQETTDTSNNDNSSEGESFGDEEDVDMSSIDEDERMIDNTSYEKMNLEQEMKWAEKNLPWLTLGERVIVLKSLDKIAKNGAESWGIFKNGCIYLLDTANKGTLYHEAYHAVSRMCLAKDERNELYNEVRNYTKNSSLTDKECEEYLAERFREYTQSEQEEKSFTDKILRWFKELWQKITCFKRYPHRMNNLFKNINNGSYSKDFSTINSIYNSNRELSNIGTKEEYNDYLESITEKSNIKGVAYTTGNMDSEGNTLIMKLTENSSFSYMNSDMFNVAGRSIGIDTSIKKGDTYYNATCKPCIITTDSNVSTLNNKAFNGISYVNTKDRPLILGSNDDIEGFRSYMNKQNKNNNKAPFGISERGVTNEEFNNMSNAVRDKMTECF